MDNLQIVKTCNNILNLVQQYAWICVCGYYLFRKVISFTWGKLEETFLPQGTDNVLARAYSVTWSHLTCLQGIHIGFFFKLSTCPGRILLAHSTGKNGNWPACKWQVYFIIFMWPIFQNIMSVVVAVVRHRIFSYTLPTFLNGISNQNCWCDCTMAFSVPTALRSTGEWQNINWACNGEYHIQSRMVDQNNDYFLWKKAANLSLFYESLKWMKWSEVVRMQGTHKETVKNLSSVQVLKLVLVVCRIFSWMTGGLRIWIPVFRLYCV